MLKTTRFANYVPVIAIVAGCLILLLSTGTRAGFGLFLQPVSADLGWGRGVFAFAMALQNLLWGASQPFVGAIADKYGSGRTIAVGGVLYAIGVALMSGVETPLALNFSTGLLVGVGLSGTSFAVVLGAIARHVSEEKRSLALGLGTAAGSLGQFTMVPLGQLFLTSYGWSQALVLLSVCSLIIVPASIVLTGRSAETGGTNQKNLSLRDALSEAFGHRGYLLLTAGFFVCGFHVAFIAVHLPSYIVDKGLSANYGAWALAVVGLFNVIGSLLAGVMGGRYSKKYCLSFLYFGRAILMAVFVLLPTTPVSVMMFAGILGLLWLSTVPLTSGLVAQIFGPQYLSTLFGIVFLSHQIGSFLGVWLGGYLYDSTGSYDVVWWIGVVLGIASALLHWPINETNLRVAPT